MLRMSQLHVLAESHFIINLLVIHWLLVKCYKCHYGVPTNNLGCSTTSLTLAILSSDYNISTSGYVNPIWIRKHCTIFIRKKKIIELIIVKTKMLVIMVPSCSKPHVIICQSIIVCWWMHCICMFCSLWSHCNASVLYMCYQLTSLYSKLSASFKHINSISLFL